MLRALMSFVTIILLLLITVCQLVPFSSELAPGRIRRNMPEPIPVMVLGRLAVDLAWQRRSLGKALLRDAILRTIQVSEVVGVKALLVHALSDQAVRFYEANGFYPSPSNPRTLFLPLSEV